MSHLLLQQTIGPQPNVSNSGNTAHTTRYGKNQYIIYASGQSVEIYTADFAHQQTLETPSTDTQHSITSAVMSSVHGMIAVATKETICLYIPTRNDEPSGEAGSSAVNLCRWEFSSTIPYSETINCLSWHPDGSALLSGGQSIAVWGLDGCKDSCSLSLYWKARAPLPIEKLAYSPDGMFFASMGKNDRLVKIWFKSDIDRSRYDFLYLPHACQVLNFEWRQNTHRRNPFYNAILTSSADMFTRIWTQGTTTAPYMFEMRASIDPRSSMSAEERHSRASLSSAGKVKRRDRGQWQKPEPERDFEAVHWMSADAISDAIGQQGIHEEAFVKTKRKSATSAKKSSRLRDMMREYPDILFWIGIDGSLTIWGIQHLDASPKRTAKVLMIIKTENAVSPVDYDIFRGNIQVYHESTFLEKSAIYFPAEIQVLAMSPSGLLACYTLNLEDFFGSAWANMNLRLEHMWVGHRTPLSYIVRHPSLNMLATTSSEGEINIYRISAPQKAVRERDGVDLLCSFVSKHKKPLFKWVPAEPFAVVCMGDTLVLEEVDGSGAERVDTLRGHPAGIDFSSIMLFQDQTGSDGLVPIHVVALSVESKNSFIWTLYFQGHTYETSKFRGSIQLKGLDDTTTQFMVLNCFPGEVQYCPSESAVVFATIASECIQFWTLSQGGLGDLSDTSPCEDVYWHMLQHWPCGSIKMSKADNLGNIVLVEESGPLQYKISIFSLDNWRFNPNACHSFTFSGDIQAIDLHTTFGAQTILAIGTSSSTYTYCFERSDSGTAKISKMSENHLQQSNERIQTIGWLLNGLLLVATNSKVYVYGKWVHEDSSPTKLPSNIHSVIDSHNGRLVEYHPNLLVHYLLWGKYDLVKYMLSFIHKFIKLMTEANRAIEHIPTALWKTFSNEGSKVGNVNYDELFSTEVGQDSEMQDVGEFGKSHASYLSEILTIKSLPGLSHIDQMKLLSVVDTFWQIEQQKRSLDDNGARYMLSTKLYLSSQKSFPLPVRPTSLSFRDIAWAFYSDSQENLVDFFNNAFNGKPVWSDAKSVGVGYWTRNLETLRRLVESFARNQYMANDDKDPIGCSLIYIALKKKNVLLGLWKLANNHPEQGAMLKFLANDFSEERWQKAAVKNAYALLGKQRYEYAAAFFLLGNRLRDAVNVCLKQLNDVQLAMVLCKLQEGDESPLLKEIIETSIIPTAFGSGDRWLASIGFSLLKDKSRALLSTIMPAEAFAGDTAFSRQSSEDPLLILLFEHLVKTYKSMRVPLPDVSVKAERDFNYLCALSYERMGCPALSLDIWVRLVETIKRLDKENAASVKKAGLGQIASPEAKSTSQNTTTLDQSQPESLKEIDFDWGAPNSTTAQTTKDTGLDWGEMSTTIPKSEGLDWGEFSSTQPAKSEGLDWGGFSSTQPKSDGLDWGEFTSEINTTLDDDSPKLADDKPNQQNNELTSSFGDLDNNVYVLSRECKIDLNVGTRRQWFLAIRLAAIIHKSVATVSKNMDVLDHDTTFKEYFDLLASGIKKIGEIVQMSAEHLEIVITSRCTETDAVLAFTQIPRLSETSPRTPALFSSLLVESCNNLFRLAFAERAGHLLYDTNSINDLAMRLLWSLTHMLETNVNESRQISLYIVSQTAATSLLCLSICAALRQDFKSLWWLVGMSDRFFHVLVGGAKTSTLKPLILDIVTNREPMVPPDSESDNEDSDVEEIIFSEMYTLAEIILRTVALQQVGIDLSVYVAHLKNISEADEVNSFLSEALLKGSSRLLKNLHGLVMSSSCVSKFKPGKMSKYIQGKYEKAVWALMRRTSNTTKMIELIVPPAALASVANSAEVPKEVISDAGHESGEAPETHVKPSLPEDTYEVIFEMSDTINTFAINPLDNNNIVIATQQTMLELDINSAISFFERKGIFVKNRASVDDLALPAAHKDPPALFFGEAEFNSKPLQRNVSYDSLQRALRKSMTNLRQREDSLLDLNSGQLVQRNVAGVTDLAAHPGLNYYIASVSDGQSESVVKLFQFGQKKELVTYGSAGCTNRFTRCRFDPYGLRFGVCDMKGELRLWKFEGSQQSLQPILTFNCNTAMTNDFTFLDSVTLFATAGISTSGHNVNLWDTLLPPSKARVKAFTTGESGAYSCVYSAQRQTLYAGSKKGEILIFDLRQRVLRRTIQAHEATVKSLAIHQNMLYSGSLNGEIKVWETHQLDYSSSHDGLIRRGHVDNLSHNSMVSPLSSSSSSSAAAATPIPITLSTSSSTSVFNSLQLGLLDGNNNSGSSSSIKPSGSSSSLSSAANNVILVCGMDGSLRRSIWK